MTLPLLAGVLLAALAAAPTGPPTPDEQRLFAEGQRAFDAGNPRDAVTAWKAGYELRRDPAFLVRIGEAQEKAGASPEAVESYRRYLREVPEAADRPDIEQRIARLNPGIVPTKPPAKETGVETPGDFGGAPAPVFPGAAPSAPAAAPPAGAGLVAPATDDEAARTAQDDGGWTAVRATAWISVAATAGLLGVAAYYGASAASKKDDVNRLLVYRDQTTNIPLEYSTVAAQYEEAYRQGRQYDSRAKLMLLLAGGTAAIATTFFIIDKTRGEGPQLALVPDGARPGFFGAWRWVF